MVSGQGRAFEERVIELDTVRRSKGGQRSMLRFRDATMKHPVGYGARRQDAPPWTATSRPDSLTPTQLGDRLFDGDAPGRGDCGVHARYYSPMVNMVKLDFDESPSSVLKAILQRINLMWAAMLSIKKTTPPVNLMSFDAVAARLEAVRVALEIDKAELCRRCGIQPSTYSNYLSETKRHRPDPETAAAIARGLDVTMDWIYRGSLVGLNDKMRSALAQSPYAAP